MEWRRLHIVHDWFCIWLGILPREWRRLHIVHDWFCIQWLGILPREWRRLHIVYDWFCIWLGILPREWRRLHIVHDWFCIWLGILPREWRRLHIVQWNLRIPNAHKTEFHGKPNVFSSPKIIPILPLIKCFPKTEPPDSEFRTISSDRTNKIHVWKPNNQIKSNKNDKNQQLAFKTLCRGRSITLPWRLSNDL